MQLAHFFSPGSPHSMFTHKGLHDSRTGSLRSWLQPALRPILNLLTHLPIWEERARQRRQLRHLDDRLLKDIGISRTDAYREAQKPRWRA